MRFLSPKLVCVYNYKVSNQNFSSAGGGGERTLYAALLSIKSKFPEAKVALFIKANAKNQNTLSEIRKKALVSSF
jgi:hypothetical protein